jgi:hypothetical protein
MSFTWESFLHELQLQDNLDRNCLTDTPTTIHADLSGRPRPMRANGNSKMTQSFAFGFIAINETLLDFE